QSKSAIADFDHFVEWPNPRYSEVRLGRGCGWGSGEVAEQCPLAPPPTPTLPHKGGGRRRLACVKLLVPSLAIAAPSSPPPISAVVAGTPDEDFRAGLSAF